MMDGRQRHLQFVPPTVERFEAVLRPMLAETRARVRLVGSNALADALAGADWMRGGMVERIVPAMGIESSEATVCVFTETAGDLLSEQLMACLGHNCGNVVAPITDWHYSKKPLFLISIPKAGTHMLYELARALGYDDGVELPEFPKGGAWYCVEYSNSHTVASDFFVDTVRRAPFGNRHHPFMSSPALFVYRHPLDILVSEAHYYAREGKTAFAGWLSHGDFQQRVMRLLNDNWLLGPLRERIGGFLPWLDFPNVIAFSFEELVGDAGGGNAGEQAELIWSLQLKLQVPGSPHEIAAKVFNPDSPTFRSGQIGGYRQQLSSELIADFAARNADLLAQLGYPKDGRNGLPAQRKARRQQRMRYSAITYEDMPLAIERDFIGCNLVRFRGRIYALPMTAGSVGLETASPETLAALPSGTSLSEVKALLLIGHTNFSRHRQMLDALAGTLTHPDNSMEIARYWTDQARPAIVEVYQGYNVVAYRGRFWGIRPELGPVDLTGDPGMLAGSYEVSDVLIAPSLHDLYADIDRCSTAMRVLGRAQALEAKLQDAAARMQAVQETQAQLDRQMREQEARCEGLETAAMRGREAVQEGLAQLEERLEAKLQDAAARMQAVQETQAQLDRQMREQEARCEGLETAAMRGREAVQEGLAQLEERLEAKLQDAAARMQAVQETQAQLDRQMREQEARVADLQQNWAVRAARHLASVFRGGR